MPGIAPRITAWRQLNAGTPAASAPSSLTPVTFPATPLKTVAYIALGADPAADPATWSWADISDRVRYADGVNITHGRGDWAVQADPARCMLRLDNRDGRFSRRNPNSPYYGLLTRNTPIWLMVNPGPAAYTRFQGFVNEWPTRWDKSGNDSTVPIVANGILRRLGHARVSRSALTRSALALGPTGYWPMEDGSQATVAGSALPGGAPLAVFGTVDFAATDGPPGSGQLCDGLTSDTGTLLVPDVIDTSSTAWQISLVSRVQEAASAATLLFWEDHRAGAAYKYWQISIETSEGFQVGVFANNTGLQGAFDTIGGSSTATVTAGEWYHIVWRQESGGTRTLYLNGTAYAAGVNAVAGPPINLQITPAGAVSSVLPVSVGHLGLWADSTTDVPSLYQAMLGYVGETAVDRLERLCDEEGVSLAVTAQDSVTMGPQPVGAFLDLARECETADGGLLGENGFGLGYLSRFERENSPAIFTLDFDLGQVSEPPEPTDDDRFTGNLWAASRPSGSTAIVEETTGALGTASIGTYDDQVTVNVEADDDLPHQAGWRVHLGTWDEDRWPRIDINLTRSTELIPTWATLPYGARLKLLHPPSQTSPDAIDAFIDGYTEAWNGHEWRAALGTVPAKPYDVGKLANTTGDTDPLLGWLDWTSCVLATAVGTGDTSWSITATPVDTTTADDFPRDVWVEGELVTVTACSGASAPQTWTVTRSVNGVSKSHTAGATITLAHPIVLTL